MSQTPHHLYPLQTDPQNEEPYLRLPPPHDNIIITPPRPEDFSAIAEVLNEREVYTWLYSPKYPVSEDQAQDRLDGATKASQLSLRELERLYQTDGGQALDLSCSAVVGSCPVKSLREVKQDGTQVYIGDIGVRRSTFFHVRDNQSRDALAKENLEREVGDPEIVWTIGYYLAISHHGRGIMSAAVRTLIEGWMIPRMDTRIIHVGAFTGNRGSVRVFEKNGFVSEDPVDYPLINNSGIKHQGLHVLTWKRQAKT